MKVIIPVAGIGKRLRPHTLAKPKPLLKVANKAILDYLLEPLEKLEPEEVIFVIGYKGDMIENHVRDKYRFKVRYVVQNRLLGLGYAIRIALNEITSSDILIILGDTIVECNLEEFVKAGEYALGLKAIDINQAQRFGIAEINDGMIVGLEEKPDKPKSNMALIGLYYFCNSEMLKDELDLLVKSGKTTSGEIQLTDALAQMIEKGIKFKPFEIDAWFDCGKKETILKTNRHLLNKFNNRFESDNSKLIEPVLVNEKVIVDNSEIGSYVTIDKNAEIVNSTISNTIVGEGVIIRNSHIVDSIIGDNSKVENQKGVLNIGQNTSLINNDDD